MKARLLIPLFFLTLPGCPGSSDVPTGTKKGASPGAHASPSPKPSPSTQASASPSPSPTAAATSPKPSPTGTAGASPSPSPTAAAAVVSGTVFDEAGKPVAGAHVTVSALGADGEAASPQTVNTTSAGTYEFKSVPKTDLNTNCRLEATKEGWTTRRMVFDGNGAKGLKLDFGGTGTTAALFISNQPEITQVVVNKTGEDTVGVKVTVSEFLDDANRRLLEDSIRILPANQAAAPDSDSPGPAFAEIGATGTQRPFDPDDTAPNGGYNRAAVPNHAVPRGADAVATEPWDYAIGKSSIFKTDNTSRGKATWNGTNLELTLVAPIPLIASSATTRYQVALVPNAGVMDKDRLPMTTPFYAPESVDKAALATAPWAATHRAAYAFDLERIVSAPKLVSAAYTKNLGNDSRFELTFTRAMVTFNGRPGGHVSAPVRDGSLLKGLTFAISDRAGGTKTITLKGGAAVPVVPAVGGLGKANDRLTGTIGGSEAIEKEVGLVPRGNGTDGLAYAFGDTLLPFGSSLTAAGGTAGAGQLLISCDAANPRTLFIWVHNRTNIFNQAIVEIKVRLEGVVDPAGNPILGSDADSTQITGTI